MSVPVNGHILMGGGGVTFDLDGCPDIEVKIPDGIPFEVYLNGEFYGAYEDFEDHEEYTFAGNQEPREDAEA